MTRNVAKPKSAKGSKHGDATRVTLGPPAILGAALAAPPLIEGLPPTPRFSAPFMTETNGGSSLENVPGFDAYVARSNGLFATKTNSRPRDPDDRTWVAQSIIGEDDRVPVSDTTALPWRCIAHLDITYSSGKRATGTAWFLGRRALGTAGHNIFHKDYGKASRILVTPGYDGYSAPFKSYHVADAHCPVEWLAGHGGLEHDYGVLLLDTDEPGSKLGWFGYASYSEPQLAGLQVNVSGYGIDRTPATQYYNGGRLTDVTDDFLIYPFDTEGGMSGAPIFALFSDNRRVAVGVHTYGGTSENRARRIDDTVFDFFRLHG
ncbi:trypsin-like serine peptidase [Sphingomonas sp. LT1P40]|uniref:trypsin-like serine peptidase n=1 Tax=Alteristakelama amylovorans TaxID=3096166 RepID=UPI002FC6BC9D